MRVLLISQEMPPETAWGGIGTYMGIIAPALARAGAEVHVLSVVRHQPRSSKVVDDVHVHRAPLVRLPGVGRLSRLPETWGRISLAAAVAREYRRLGMRFDVAECPEWGAEGLVLALRRALPLVIRLHSGAAQVFPYLGPIGLDLRTAIRLEEVAVGRAQLTSGTRSQIARLAARSLLPDDALRVINYPVSPANQEPPPDGPPTVLFAGRFEHRKNPERLVRCAPAVLSAVPEARFLFLGRDTYSPRKPSYANWLQKLAAELGVAHAIEVLERWGPDAVADGLRRSTVCAIPSLWESFGYVAAEAAARGRPVIGSRIPGLEDIVKDSVTGLLVPPEDTRAWGDALTFVLNSPDQARSMGAAGRQEIRSRCDPDRIAELTLEAYEAAILRFGSRKRLSDSPVS